MQKLFFFSEMFQNSAIIYWSIPPVIYDKKIVDKKQTGEVINDVRRLFYDNYNYNDVILFVKNVSFLTINIFCWWTLCGLLLYPNRSKVLNQYFVVQSNVVPTC